MVGIPEEPPCEDASNLCDQYVDYCKDAQALAWMQTNCQKSCGYCK